MDYLIDPTDVINYERTDGELQLWWLFSCVVAGKKASRQAALLNDFMLAHTGETPFEKLRGIGEDHMLEAVKSSRLGQYTRLSRQFLESMALDLRSCSVADLEAIHGCGPKTARMFVMMSRPGVRHAALDTHVLRHLREHGIEAPKATPPAGKLYASLEAAFLELADASGMTVAEYDLTVWKKFSSGGKQNPEAEA